MRLSRRGMAAGGISLFAARQGLAQRPAGLLQRLLDAGEVRIGVWLGAAAPWGYQDDRGELDGSEIALAYRLASDLGLRPILVPLDFVDRMPALSEGRVDVLSATTAILPVRLRQVAFARPHGTFRVVVVTRGGRQYGSLDALAGLRVAVLAGGVTGESIFRELPAAVRLVPVLNFDEAFALLERQEVDGVAVPDFVHRRRSIARPELGLENALPVADFAYALAVRHGEHDLLRAINTCIFLWEQEGFLAEIHETFMQAPRPNLERL